MVLENEMPRDGRPFGVGHRGRAGIALVMAALWPSAALADEPAPAQPAPAQPAPSQPASSEAGAESAVSQCVAAHAEVQRLRKEHQLLEARRALKDCTRPECPVPVLRECAAWIVEIERETPSVIFNVTTKAEQIPGSKIFVDGQAVELPSSGLPLALNPGRHTYRVEHPGYAPATKEFIVFEGQRFTQLDVALEPLVDPAPGAPKQPVPVTETYRPVPALTYVLAGVGLVGMAGFAVFGAMGSSDLDNLERTCMPGCTDSDLDPVRGKFLAADISLGVGAAGLAGAALTFLLRPTEERPVVVSVTPSSTGVSGSVLFRGL
jgi:hypothetical protein